MSELWSVIVKFAIALIVVSFLILSFNSIAYFIWLVVWWFNAFFYTFQYIGADCALLSTIRSMFITIPIWLLILFIYNKVSN